MRGGAPGRCERSGRLGRQPEQVAAVARRRRHARGGDRPPASRCGRAACAAGSPAGSGRARSRPRSCRAPRRSPRRRCRGPTGPPSKRWIDGLEQLAVHHVEAVRVDVEHRQRLVGERLGDAAARPSRRRSRAPGAAAGWRCAACRASGARSRSAPSASIGTLEQAGRAARRSCASSSARVELEPRDDAEAVAQRVGEHAGARGRADQRERLQVELDRARRRALADHDVDLVVLQRRVEDLLDDRRQAMDLVDEEHVVASRGW